jgi:hypothetical protein
MANPFQFGRASLADFGVTQPATLSKALRRLEDSEITWPTSAGWQLVNAAFEQWLLRDQLTSGGVRPDGELGALSPGVAFR